MKKGYNGIHVECHPGWTEIIWAKIIRIDITDTQTLSDARPNVIKSRNIAWMENVENMKVLLMIVETMARLTVYEMELGVELESRPPLAGLDSREHGAG